MAWHHLHTHHREAPEWLKERWASKGKIAVAIYDKDTFHDRKRKRTDYYEKYIKGWKLVTCTACSGSGYYDNHGSPKCGCCEGTGKMREKPVPTQPSHT